MAVAEAMGWLTSQGLIMRDPDQSGTFYVLTRRAQTLKSRADVEAFVKGNALPIQLLQPQLAEKVHHLFVRGDHDVAVFQAFKSVEVAVRTACRYDNTVIGKRLVIRAFNPDDGPLRNVGTTQDEREAEMALFVGAIGHCKNPASHRDVDLDREEAARLIVFASHLLAIVDERKP
ncbi:MAG TPA: TIGR02391 family protein [Allosphingosinicella sp.]